MSKLKRTQDIHQTPFSLWLTVRLSGLRYEWTEGLPCVSQRQSIWKSKQVTALSERRSFILAFACKLEHKIKLPDSVKLTKSIYGSPLCVAYLAPTNQPGDEPCAERWKIALRSQFVQEDWKTSLTWASSSEHIIEKGSPYIDLGETGFM